MEDSPATSEPEPGSVEKFWQLAKFHARLNPIPSYFGPTSLESVPPPAFALGVTPDEADVALDALLADRGASLPTPRDAFDSDDDLPSVGGLGIVVDGNGHPHVLVETTEVTVDDEMVVEQLRVVYSA